MPRAPAKKSVEEAEAGAANAARAEKLFARGMALHGRNQFAEAQAAFADVLKLQPDHAEALHALGVIAAQGRDPSAALVWFDRAVAVDPQYALAWFSRGIALEESGRLDDAIASYDRALAVRPGFEKAAVNRRNALQRSGRPDAAALSVAATGKTLADPSSAKDWYERAMALLQGDRHEEAIAHFDRAIAIDPQHAEAYCGRAISRRQTGQNKAAIADYERAIALKPKFYKAHNNLGVVLQVMGRPREAIASYERALAANPRYARAHINRGNALLELRDLQSALASYEQAIALDPRNTEIFSNRGVVLHQMNRLQEAVASHEHAVSMDPQRAEGHWNLSNALLLSGDWSRGWQEFEWRWKHPGLKLLGRRKALQQPRWTGTEPLQGKTLLLQAEQGLGDTIQFCRYARLAAARGARVLMEVQAPLLGVLQGLAGVAGLLTPKSPLPPYDLHCPLLSLPLAFGTTVSTVPWSGPYIEADHARMQAWRRRLGEPRALRVGLVWSGNQKHKGDRNRSIPLQVLLPLLGDGCEWFSLHKEVRKADATVLAAQPRIRHFGEELADFADTAALCALMDVVISVDTSVAHLAGAMGRPLWLLLPDVPDWRWLQVREDTPWYPTARLFRQSEPGNWSGVISRVQQELQGLRSGRRHQPDQ